MMRIWFRSALTAWAMLAVLAPAALWACPFCSAVSQTFTEEINTVQVGVIAKLIDKPAAPRSMPTSR